MVGKATNYRMRSKSDDGPVCNANFVASRLRVRN